MRYDTKDLGEIVMGSPQPPDHEVCSDALPLKIYVHPPSATVASRVICSVTNNVRWSKFCL